MSKHLMNFAVYMAFGLICCVLLWRPWAPDEASMGFKSADEEMRALLQRQTEERDAASKASGGGKEKPSTAAPPKHANTDKQAQPAGDTAGKNGEAQPAGAIGSEARPGQTHPQDAKASAALYEKTGSGDAEGKSDGSGQTRLGEAKETAASLGKINLNSATAEQLDELPGIGASRAQSIIALRQKLGGKFTSVNQLLEVKGIGEKMLEKIAPLVTVGP